MTYTAQQKLDAIEREIGYRVYVYERRVEAGHMSRKKADYEIAIMRAIADDYREAAKASGQLQLF
jgi:hypothetical protein